ncbi:unnamed protein product [Boreogadus saida]
MESEAARFGTRSPYWPSFYALSTISSGDSRAKRDRHHGNQPQLCGQGGQPARRGRSGGANVSSVSRRASSSVALADNALALSGREMAWEHPTPQANMDPEWWSLRAWHLNSEELLVNQHCPLLRLSSADTTLWFRSLQSGRTNMEMRGDEAENRRRNGEEEDEG